MKVVAAFQPVASLKWLFDIAKCLENANKRDIKILLKSSRRQFPHTFSCNPAKREVRLRLVKTKVGAVQVREVQAQFAQMRMPLVEQDGFIPAYDLEVRQYGDVCNTDTLVQDMAAFLATPQTYRRVAQPHRIGVYYYSNDTFCDYHTPFHWEGGVIIKIEMVAKDATKRKVFLQHGANIVINIRDIAKNAQLKQGNILLINYNPWATKYHAMVPDEFSIYYKFMTTT